MGKSWDNFSKEQKKYKEYLEIGGRNNDLCKGLAVNPLQYKFEGMIEFFTPIWKEVYRVLKPGAFGFIMCIPRQDCLSRMMISLEDAGFNINFSSIYWTYATGFPKAMNIGKKIDKRLGKEREVVGRNEKFPDKLKPSVFLSKVDETNAQITAPSSNQAKQMEGSYGGFQPKPAVECIIVVMKSLSEKSYIDQAMKDGKGVTWFDDVRIPYADAADEDQIQNKKEYNMPPGFTGGDIMFSGGAEKSKDYAYKASTNGRFPANLLISDDILDDNKDHESNKYTNNFDSFLNLSDPGRKEKKIDCSNGPSYGDSGGYSRFFSLDAWAERNLPFLIVPKAAKKEKNLGVDYESESYVCEGCGNLGEICHLKPCINCGGKLVLKKVVRNNHPTVKPIKLMSYLITMGSRSGDTIIDPFAGSGTTGCAAVTLGRNYILIEKDPKYIKIIKARLKYWSSLPIKL